MKTNATQVGSITFKHKTWAGAYKDDVQACYTEYSDNGSGASETEVDISQEDAARIIYLLLGAYPQIARSL